MGIVIFKDFTTEDYLCELEKASEKYKGLYVDMENAEERKYVKDKASTINSLLKKLDRARIDIARDFKIKVEAEAEVIKERLEEANRPFTLLIDEHKEARAKILAEKKAIEDAKALAIQIKADHEEALMMNKVFDFEREEAKRKQAERDEQIRKEAAEQARRESEEVLKRAEQERIEANRRAEQAAIETEQRIKREEQERIAREQAEIQARERNKQHKAKINNAILSALISAGISEQQGKDIITMIAKGEVPNVRIRY